MSATRGRQSRRWSCGKAVTGAIGAITAFSRPNSERTWAPIFARTSSAAIHSAWVAV